jgi:hypothetical protein
VAVVDPERIKSKPKFHILTHTPEDVRRFGPILTSSTEIFECYNAIFRFCSILSNHHAPSRDIALSFSSLCRFKHISSGGWWKDDSNDRWTRAGIDVRQFFLKNHQIQEYLGWLDPKLMQPGTQIISIKVAHSLLQSGHVTLCKVGQRETVWCKTAASHAKPLISNPPNLHDQARALQCQQVISKSQEPAKLGDFVVAGELAGETQVSTGMDLFMSYTLKHQTYPGPQVNRRSLD